MESHKRALEFWLPYMCRGAWCCLPRLLAPQAALCLTASCMACREAGFETIMMNSNPETVSTDYDTSSRLYFEPLTVEDVLNVLERERPEGIIVQFGGQTPLSLAAALQKALTERPIPAASGGCLLLVSQDNCAGWQ